MLNMNWQKIHSIILSFTSHGFRNFPLLIHIHFKFIHEFSKPYELLIFWVRITHKMLNMTWQKNSLNNFIFHLSWFEKLFPWLIHIHSKPFVNISKPYELLFFWVRVTCKKLIVNWIKIHSIILSFTCHGLRNFPLTHTDPLKTSCEFSKPYELLFFELELLIKC